MATKKKTRPKIKSKKTGAKKSVTKKKVTRRKVAIKRATSKKKSPRGKTSAKTKRSSKRASKTTVAAPLPSEARVGIVTHYYSALSVAIVQMESGSLRQGDTVHIKGHTSDFRQRVESLEIDHLHVEQVATGQVFGLRVKEHAREHDVVYKVPSP